MKTRVRAIIFIGENLVLIHRIKKGNEYWVFPGGGVEEGEEFVVALMRECKEELGVDVMVNDLFCEFTFNNQLERFYNCCITCGKLGTGDGPEFQSGTSYEGMYEIDFISRKNLEGKNIVPDLVCKKILAERG